LRSSSWSFFFDAFADTCQVPIETISVVPAVISAVIIVESTGLYPLSEM
jgi:hypothetical protein